MIRVSQSVSLGGGKTRLENLRLVRCEPSPMGTVSWTMILVDEGSGSELRLNMCRYTAILDRNRQPAGPLTDGDILNVLIYDNWPGVAQGIQIVKSGENNGNS